MNTNTLINLLQQNAQAINSLAGSVSDLQARWKPDPESWSILEVVYHLYDEEVYDFRVRLDIILQQSGKKWPPIDPAGWVTERAYNQQELQLVLADFLSERENSLQWLRTLRETNWDATYEAPWGPISAGDIFASWVAHDLLHLRQLVELNWAYTQTLVGPYSTRYAGEW